ISGGLRVLNTDYVIGTTGIMGPGGGSPEKTRRNGMDWRGEQKQDRYGKMPFPIQPRKKHPNGDYYCIKYAEENGSGGRKLTTARKQKFKFLTLVRYDCLPSPF